MKMAQVFIGKIKLILCKGMCCLAAESRDLAPWEEGKWHAAGTSSISLMDFPFGMIAPAL